MPVTDFEFKEKYQYQNGFDCYFEYVLSLPGTTESPPAGQAN